MVKRKKKCSSQMETNKNKKTRASKIMDCKWSDVPKIYPFNFVCSDLWWYIWNLVLQKNLATPKFSLVILSCRNFPFYFFQNNEIRVRCFFTWTHILALKIVWMKGKKNLRSSIGLSHFLEIHSLHICMWASLIPYKFGSFENSDL